MSDDTTLDVEADETKAAKTLGSMATLTYPLHAAQELLAKLGSPSNHPRDKEKVRKWLKVAIASRVNKKLSCRK